MRKPQTIEAKDLQAGNFILFPIDREDGSKIELVGLVLGGSKDNANKTNILLAPVYEQGLGITTDPIEKTSFNDEQTLKAAGFDAPQTILKSPITVPLQTLKDNGIQRIGFIPRRSEELDKIRDAFSTGIKVRPTSSPLVIQIASVIDNKQRATLSPTKTAPSSSSKERIPETFTTASEPARYRLDSTNETTYSESFEESVLIEEAVRGFYGGIDIDLADDVAKKFSGYEYTPDENSTQPDLGPHNPWEEFDFK